MSELLFQGFDDLRNLVIIAPLTYFALVAILRMGGKRTLSKMNSFDFIVTVALGSILANTLLSSTTSLSEGMLATGLLVLLQYLVTLTASRSRLFCRVIKSDPRLLLYNGTPLDKALKSEHIARNELLAAVRKSGHSTFDEVGAVILENDGSLSVLSRPHAKESIPKDSVLLETVKTEVGV